MKLSQVLLVCLALAVSASASADEFTKEDLERWNAQYQEVVKQGRALWTSADIGKNGVAS